MQARHRNRVRSLHRHKFFLRRSQSGLLRAGSPAIVARVRTGSGGISIAIRISRRVLATVSFFDTSIDGACISRSAVDDRAGNTADAGVAFFSTVAVGAVIATSVVGG